MVNYDESGYHGEEDALVSFGILCICIVVSFLSLIGTFYQLFIQSGKKKNQQKLYVKSMQLTALSSLTFNFLFCVVTTIIQIKSIFTNQPYRCGVRSVNAPLLGLARLSLYLFFLSRFAGIFKGTQMDLPNRVYIIMIIFMIITCLGAVGVFNYTSALSKDCDTTERFISFAWAALQDIIWSVITMYLFISRLDIISKAIGSVATSSVALRPKSPSNNPTSLQLQNVSSGNNNPTSMSKSKENSHSALTAAQSNTKMLRFCVRLAILTITTTLSSVVLIGVAAGPVHSAVSACLDACINGVCLLLSFSANNRLYYFLCKYFIRCCKGCINIANGAMTGSLVADTDGSEKESSKGSKNSSKGSKGSKGSGKSSKSSKRGSGKSGTKSSSKEEKAIQVAIKQGNENVHNDNENDDDDDVHAEDNNDTEDEGEEDDNDDNDDNGHEETLQTKDIVSQLPGMNNYNDIRSNRQSLYTKDTTTKRESYTFGTRTKTHAFEAVQINLVEAKDSHEHFYLDMREGGDHLIETTHTENDQNNGREIVESVDLQDLTYDLRIKGKRNQKKAKRIDIAALDKDDIVEDFVTEQKLKGRRTTFTATMTVSHPDVTAYKKETDIIALQPNEQEMSKTEIGDNDDDDRIHITLVLYELNDVIATNCNIYDEMDPDDENALDLIRKKDILLSFGMKERINQLKKHFETLLEFNQKMAKHPGTYERVLCFLLSNSYDTEVMHGIIKRANISKYFQTQLRPKQFMCHVIGKNHFVKKDIDKEYLSILQIIHVLNRSNENVLYVGHNKELIQHLVQINACHTYFVKTKGMTKNDMDMIQEKFTFGITD